MNTPVFDQAPVTVTQGQYRAAWARAIVVDDKLYVFRNPQVTPSVEVFDLAPGTGPVAARNRGYAVGDFDIQGCGCAKGSWNNWSVEQLLALAPSV